MSKKSSPQIWLEYAVTRSLLGVLGILPARVSDWFGITAGRIAFLFAHETA